MYEQIDHIVYAVNDLRAATAKFSNETGLKVFTGGLHPDQGTHNALIRIGDRTYLEFIAIDDKIEATHSHTWMGLDHLHDNKITRWCLRSDNVERDAALLGIYKPELRKIIMGSREKSDGTMLNWLMTTVLPAPEVEVAPFLIDWKKSVHPTVGLPLDCSIKSLRIEHTENQILTKLLSQLSCPSEVEASLVSSIRLSLDTPKGVYTI